MSNPCDLCLICSPAPVLCVSRFESLSDVTQGGIGSIAVAHGDREIYFSLFTVESDVWLVELE